MKGNFVIYSALCKLAQVCLRLGTKRKCNLHFVVLYGVFITAYPDEAFVTLTQMTRYSIFYLTFLTYVVISYPLLCAPIPRCYFVTTTPVQGKFAPLWLFNKHLR